MYHLCSGSAKAPKYKFHFKSKLFSLDLPSIKLCLSLFPCSPFRQTKAGIKIHALLGHNSSIQAFATITEARPMKAVSLKHWRYLMGSLYFLQGFIYYLWLWTFGSKGIFFVT